MGICKTSFMGFYQTSYMGFYEATHHKVGFDKTSQQVGNYKTSQ
jgi:hypothetical protein